MSQGSRGWVAGRRRQPLPSGSASPTTVDRPVAAARARREGDPESCCGGRSGDITPHWRPRSTAPPLPCGRSPGLPVPALPPGSPPTHATAMRSAMRPVPALVPAVWQACVMRFDDLELLRFVLEQEETPTGALYDGLRLLQALAGGLVSDQNDYRAFANELVLAHRAGLLDFEERISAGSLPVDPAVDSHRWLQQINDIHLTIAGRDRAQGRVILRPLPDPDEDDGRPVAGMTLEEIARAIGDAYTGSQIPQFLVDSGIPEMYVVPFAGDSKWHYVLTVLDGLDHVGSASRRILRQFIGAWLDNQLHTWPDEDVRRRVMRQLGQQGWHLKNGRLVVGQPEPGEPDPPPSGSRADRVARLHPAVREASKRYLETHLEVAIFEAFKAVNNRVKEMTGLDADGSELMGKAFAEKGGALQLGDPITDSGRNLQAGYRFLFMGAVRGIRNRDAHELFVPLSDEEALEQLGLASLLMRRLDDLAERRPMRSATPAE